MPGQSGLITKLDRNCGNLRAFNGILAVPLPYGVGMQIAGEDGGDPFPVEFFNFLVNRL